jgi:hypothetical protein
MFSPVTRKSHGFLTPVPQEHSLVISPALTGLINEANIPCGFRFFAKTTLQACPNLASQANRPILIGAVRALTGRGAENPEYLAHTADYFRLSGAEEVTFTFRLSARQVYLEIQGTTAGQLKALNAPIRLLKIG